MILHEHKTIPYKYGNVFKIKPVFDVHLGNRYCDERAFKKYLDDSDDKTYFVIGGDLLDSVITKDVKRYMKHSDATESDAIIDEQIDMAYEYLKPHEDRILGIGSGNHENAISKYCGTNPARRLAKMLNTVSLGYSWILRLRFRMKAGRGRTVCIRGMHGWGGGSRTQGADLTKYSKDISYWGNVQVFMYGHVHRNQFDRIDRLAWRGKGLVSEPKWILICGTFLKTYSLSDEATYSEEKGYPPIAVGSPYLLVKPERIGINIEVRT